MEQQVQQSIQEKAEVKPPIKTNWKPRRNPFGILRGRYLAIVGVFALLAIGGILLVQNMQPAPSPTPIAQQTPPPTPQVVVNELTFVKVGEGSPIYFIQKGNVAYSFNAIGNIVLFDQILSTFRFVE